MIQRVKFFLGGYYIIKLNKNPPVIPIKNICTISDCINNLIPGINGLSWVNSSENDINNLKNNLAINEEKFKQLQKWITQKFKDNEFTFSGTFREIKTAKEFIKKFIVNKENIKLIGIYLSEEYIEEFIKDNCTEKQSDYEICSELKLKKEEESKGKLKGYDLLGYEIGGYFHTLHCHNLKHELIEKFNINFNENELISEYEDAKKIVNYMNNEAGAEPVRWDIWKIKEFELP